MFAGISMIMTEEGQGQNPEGMMSKVGGEIVPFVSPFKISDDPRINVWLKKIEV